MAKRGVTWEQFAEMGRALPGVEVGTSYGTPALRVKKRFMARLRDDDPDHLVLKPVEEDEQRFLMETQPDVFFLTDHYRGYPTILVRLSKVSRGQLQELLEMCWRRLATPNLIAQAGGVVPAKPRRPKPTLARRSSSDRNVAARKR